MSTSILTCPMCKKRLRGVERECPTCRTDVSLLVDYVDSLRDGLRRAEDLTRRGELGEAVWEYLSVLEVDPDNATARKQVSRVATAVRQFDQEAPGRRFLKRLQRETRFRRWLANWGEGDLSGWLSGAFWLLLVLIALVLGYVIGTQTNKPAAPPPSTAPEKSDQAK
jgi:hypothetical protein